MPAHSLPLPDGFFDCPPLAKHEKDYLVAKAHAFATTLVESAHTHNGPVNWKPAGTYKGVSMFQGEARSRPEQQEPVTYICGVMSILGSIAEIAAFFHMSTTEKSRAFGRNFTDDMLDSCVLYTLVPPTPLAPLHQITVKWAAFEMPSLISNRDFVTLECQDSFIDSTGKRGWVRSMHSIRLPMAPELHNSHGLVRASMYRTGFVVTESDRPGFVDLMHMCQVNLKGNILLPSPVYFRAMKKRIASIVKLNRHLRQMRLSKQISLLAECDLVPKSSRMRCKLCAVKFGLVTRKARCRACGEVVCWKCSAKWAIARAHGSVEVRICMQCCVTSECDAREATNREEANRRSAAGSGLTQFQRSTRGQNDVAHRSRFDVAHGARFDVAHGSRFSHDTYSSSMDEEEHRLEAALRMEQQQRSPPTDNELWRSHSTHADVDGDSCCAESQSDESSDFVADNPMSTVSAFAALGDGEESEIDTSRYSVALDSLRGFRLSFGDLNEVVDSNITMEGSIDDEWGRDSFQSVVLLHRKIMELTQQQQQLARDPLADPVAQVQITRRVQELYQTLQVVRNVVETEF
ncbi:TPA: hypothetical protein N0F65_007282 [Lagenidium giganteum]|uniref:FYVE-type domain-containing protein n=1 Tax=Lagenidium giganteum TaxID=4803 RepID=A0AAV2Z9T6_9STRA|nr:TPA: hypothetical protein N0F65_007282 [Lagenidium giganteum]